MLHDVRRAIAALLTVTSLLGGGAVGCTARRDLVEERSRRHVPDSAAHALHDEDLRRLMGALERLRDERLPQEMDLAQQRRRRMDEIAEIAQSMEIAAADIPCVLDNVELDEGRRLEFLRLATELGDHAQQIRRHAGAGSMPEVSTALVALTATCDNCHRRFRILPLIDR